MIARTLMLAAVVSFLIGCAGPNSDGGGGGTWPERAETSIPLPPANERAELLTAASGCPDPVQLIGDSVRAYVNVSIAEWGIRSNVDATQTAAAAVSNNAVVNNFLSHVTCRAVALRPSIRPVLMDAEKEVRRAMLNIERAALQRDGARVALMEARIAHFDALSGSSLSRNPVQQYDASFVSSALPPRELLTLSDFTIEGSLTVPQFIQQVLNVDASWDVGKVQYAMQAVQGNTFLAAQNINNFTHSLVLGTTTPMDYVLVIVGSVYDVGEQILGGQ